jgi:alkylresorcinol/alkylpyrone synthase
MGVPKIQAVGTAVPDYAFEQGEIKKFAAALFKPHMQRLERLLPVFENSCIKTRNFVKPLEWYGLERSFAETNKVFEEMAFKLSLKAAQKAMQKAKVTAADIGMVIFVSTTGIATPSLDAKLIQELGLSPHTRRLPIWGLGCAGGVAGLARAAELVHSVPGKSVLLVTVELCSLTFQPQDYSKSNLVGTSLFADGAAAALINMDTGGPAVLGNYSSLLPDSEEVMGWDFIETGFKVRFSRDIPTIVKTYLPALINSACEEWGIKQSEIIHYIVHPGGAKVLSAYKESLALADDKLSCAYNVLADYGNMSSASVLFVLERFLAETFPVRRYGVMLTLGPGFSAEKVLFQW